MRICLAPHGTSLDRSIQHVCKTKTTAQSANLCLSFASLYVEYISLSESVEANDLAKGIAMEALQSGHILQSIVIKRDPTLPENFNEF